MEIQQLRCFKEVAAVRSASQAATNMGMGRAGVRLSIRELENSLSVKLFEGGDNTSSYIMTEEGKILFNYATQILSVVEKAKQQMKEMLASEPCNIRILYNDNLKHKIVPRVCSAYSERDENAHFTFQFQLVHRIEEIEQLLQIGEADIAFAQATSPGVNSLQIAMDQLFVLLPADHPLARKKQIRLRDLEDMPFILPNLDFIQQDFGLTESSLNYALKSMFMAEHIHPRYSPLSGNNDVRRSYVQAGFGYTITSGFPQNEEEVASIEIDNPYSRRPVYLLWPKNRELSIQADRFKDYCIDFYKNKHEMTWR